MRAELDVLRHNYRELLKSSADHRRFARHANDFCGRRCLTLRRAFRPATAAEVIASCEDYDADLAELFRRNEQGLRDIRKDLAEIRGDAPTHTEGGQTK